MTAAKVIPFPLDKAKHYETKNPVSVYQLFPKEVADSFVQYHEMAIEWRNNIRQKTIYEGYPHIPPSPPMIEELYWFVDEKKGFGVWILNDSEFDIYVEQEICFGWSPFVRKSTAPPLEPVHIESVEIRKQLIWYVDPDGYGQYAMLKKDGTLFIPHERPTGWCES